MGALSATDCFRMDLLDVLVCELNNNMADDCLHIDLCGS
jgi:hypothetical protein